MKKSIYLVIFLMATHLSAQQKFATHPVKAGETIQQIAEEYGITPLAIFQHNPELRALESLKANTILVIPLPTVDEEAMVDEIPSTVEEIAPINFLKHRVRRKETLFAITQNYAITEEQLKRYNKQLYAETLKKGMVLEIPQYPEEDSEADKELDFDTYTVQPKETRWSIAHRFGITVDSLVQLNPELPKNTTYIAAGQGLKVPRPKGDSIKEQEVVLYESYKVPRAIGLFRISQDYGIPIDSIIGLNPQITEIGGLKEGMELRLPKKKTKENPITTENYVFYEVKPKETLFRLTRKLGISVDSLTLFNPTLENGLKSGMVLKLPKKNAAGLEVKNALVLDRINLADSINTLNRPNLLFMLPFRLDRVDFGKNERMESQVQRRDIGAALGLYTGALVALDSLKHMGVSVNASFFDTQRDLGVVRNFLEQKALSDIDAIIGPIDPSLINEIAVRSVGSKVPVVTPFASDDALAFENLFHSMPKDGVLRDKLLDYVEKNRKDEELIIIADENHQAALDSISCRFPTARIAKMSDDGSLHLLDFEAMLFEDKTHWVFVESNDDELLASVTSILNAANSEALYRVRMFSTAFNKAFEVEEISPVHLSNLKFTFSSGFKKPNQDAFTRAYQQKFGYPPDRYAVRGFDLTFDLLLKLAFRKNLFEASQYIGRTAYSGNQFNYVDYFNAGYYNHAAYLLQHKDLQIMELEANDL